MFYRMSDETEFVGYGQGVDDQTASGQGEGLGQMSERVQAMAQTLYEQLEFLVSRYGVEAAQAITPMLVRLLESLDEEIKHRRQIQTDLELAKADREQLLNHFERERELRRKAEERHLNVEDELDLDKSALRSKLEELEGKMRFVNTVDYSYKSNYSDIWILAPKTTMTYPEKLLKMRTHFDQSMPILPGGMMKLCKST